MSTRDKIVAFFAANGNQWTPFIKLLKDIKANPMTIARHVDWMREDGTLVLKYEKGVGVLRMNDKQDLRSYYRLRIRYGKQIVNN
jgi:hypothetical protein